jgi:hypothetical protein
LFAIDRFDDWIAWSLGAIRKSALTYIERRRGDQRQELSLRSIGCYGFIEIEMRAPGK